MRDLGILTLGVWVLFKTKELFCLVHFCFLFNFSIFLI